MSRRRAGLIWVALFGVYAATLGIHAADHHRYAGDEPHYLLMARSIASDGDVDLSDQFARREYRSFYSGTLRTNGRVIAGRLVEPQPAGVSVLLAPAYALGGSTAAELVIAALAALAFVLAVALAHRLVPDPWATLAPLACALSPPALAAATEIYPDVPAAAALTAAALLALRYRDRPRLRTAVTLGIVLAPVPWLGVKYLVPAVVVLLAAWRWAARRGRGTHGLVAAEVLFASLVAYVTVNGRLYEALTPYGVGPAGKPTAEAPQQRRRARAPAAARLAVARPRHRTAALGARLRPRLLRRVAALALTPRPGRPGPPRAARDRGDRARCWCCWPARSSSSRSWPPPRSPATGSPGVIWWRGCPRPRRWPPGACATPHESGGRCAR